MSAYTMWYREGTVAITQNTKNIVGTSTYWLSAGIQPGDMFTTDGSNFFEVDSVTDSTHITLKTNYTGSTVSSSKYAVIRNFNSGMSARVAALGAQLLGYFDRYIDTDMQSIHGKSAYEVAIQNGYEGTQSEWLESLKAAGEWTDASTRLSTLETARTADETTLETHTADIAQLKKKYTITTRHYNFVSDRDYRNSIFRGSFLGYSIDESTKADWYIGDGWEIVAPTSGKRWSFKIAQFGLWYYGDGGFLGMILLGARHDNETFKFGSSNSGGWANSDAIASTNMAERIADLQEIFGDKLVTDSQKRTFHVSSAVNADGEVTSVVQVSGPQVAPLTVENIIGHKSISGGDNYNHLWVDRQEQLPFYRVFRQRHQTIIGNLYQNTWLDSYRGSQVLAQYINASVPILGLAPTDKRSILLKIGVAM